jgi:NMD protein affecting ribosome stability and mRNA decay
MKVQSTAHGHKHKSVTVHEIRQRGGVPYEVERKVCESCRRVLGEKPIRRTPA